MPTYTVRFAIEFDGCVEIEADSKGEAFEHVEDMLPGELMEFVDYDGACPQIIRVIEPPPPLKQLADQAE